MKTKKRMIYCFTEHELAVSGDKRTLIDLAHLLREAEGTIGDLRYQIEYAFDIDGVRTASDGDADRNDPDYADRYLMP